MEIQNISISTTHTSEKNKNMENNQKVTQTRHSDISNVIGIYIVLE